MKQINDLYSFFYAIFNNIFSKLKTWKKKLLLNDDSSNKVEKIENQDYVPAVLINCFHIIFSAILYLLALIYSNIKTLLSIIQAILKKGFKRIIAIIYNRKKVHDFAKVKFTTKKQYYDNALMINSFTYNYNIKINIMNINIKNNIKVLKKSKKNNLIMIRSVENRKKNNKLIQI